MKTLANVVVGAGLGVLGLAGPVGLHAQWMGTSAPGTATGPGGGGFSVIEQGPHHKIWARVSAATSPTGQIVVTTNSYVELASGLSYLQNGSWIDAREEFQIDPNGFAVALQGSCQASISPALNDAQGAVSLLTPDGLKLRSTILGLTLHDRLSGKMLVVAEVTNSLGLLVAPNVVIFSNAFSGFQADVRYVYQKGAFHQELLFAERLDSKLLTDAGFAPDFAQLQIWTEFFEPPQPGITSTVVQQESDPVLRAQMADPDVIEDDLDFGVMKMPMGTANLLAPTNSVEQAVVVSKRWVTNSQGVFLVESIPLKALAPLFAQLPPWEPAPGFFGDKEKGLYAKHRQPAPVLRRRQAERILLARAARDQGPANSVSLVADYTAVNGNLTNYTFQGDTTYYISGNVYLYGATIIEGGCVIKYTNSQPSLYIKGALNCATSMYRPAICTAKDDNSVGDPISGSTGQPVGLYAYTALDCGPGPVTVDHLRVSFANWGVAVYNSSNIVKNSQFVSNTYPVYVLNGPVTLQNLLIHGVSGQAIYSDSAAVNAVNLTVHDAAGLWYNNAGSLNLTNSLLICVTNLGAAFNGAYNATNSSDAGVFQIAGAGAHYLSASTYRNVGTTNISPSLLADLQRMTTYAPVIYSNGVQTSPLSLSPVAQRDTDIPDLGYHFDPVDFITDVFEITNTTLTVTNGAVIACYYDSAGIWVADGGAIVSVGTPVQPNWFISYSSAQEQPVSMGQLGPSSAFNVSSYHYGATGPAGFYRFTKFACPAGGGSHFYHSGSYAYSSLLLQDSEIWGGQNLFGGGTGTLATLKNNLFGRAAFTGSTSVSNLLTLSNNLIWYGSFTPGNSSSSNVWQFHDNAFYACSFPPRIPITVSNSNDAYINCGTNRLIPPNVNDVVLGSLAWQTGPLGGFYQPTNSALIDAGSTWATNAGLYHYTVTTNQVKEGSSKVDIGYHYVATDQYNKPIDTDGDGFPDYLEDTNGNGVYDAGDLGNWQVYNSPNGLVTGNGLQVFTLLR